MDFSINILDFNVTAETLVQIVMAFAGSLGFAMIFNLRRRFMLPAALAGMTAWIIYLASLGFTDDILFASCIASISVSLFAELMAKVCRTPANQFLIIALIPLIPGAPLYYMMAAITKRDVTETAFYGYRTLEFVLGLTLGICLASAFVDMLRKILRKA